MSNKIDLLKPVKTTLRAASEAVAALQSENEKLKAENKRLKTKAVETISDELKKENKRLRHQIDMSYGEFASEKEKKAFEVFSQAHIHDRKTSKVNGGKAHYIIPYGTGLGCCKTVVCQICGEKKDITDISVW